MQSGVLSVDIGTSSLKAAVIDEHGTVLKFTRCFFPSRVRAEDWVSAFFSVWQELTDSFAVQAICISGNGPTLVARCRRSGDVKRYQHYGRVPPDFSDIIQSAKNDILFLWNEPADTDRTVFCSVVTDSAAGEKAADTDRTAFCSAVTDSAADEKAADTDRTVFRSAVTDPAAGEKAADTANSVFDKTGSRGDGDVSLFVPRIAAFQHKYAHVFTRVEYLFSGPEYIAYLLTGNAVTILPESRYKATYWDDAQLRRLQAAYSGAAAGNGVVIEKLLPPFVTAGAEIGRFCGVPVIAGVPDFIAALIGTGTLTAGAACDRAGSSEGINICLSQPRRFAETLLLPSIIPDLWNSSFLIPDSGSSFQSFLTRYGFTASDYASCMEMIAAEPFRSGMDYPVSFAGQGRVFIERLAFRIRYGFDLLEKISGFRPIYTVSGGQARNACWCQMKADITGRIFAVPHCADAELLGDAALAFCALESGKGLGAVQPVSGCVPLSTLTAVAQRLIRIERYYEPDRVRASRYAEKYAVQDGNCYTAAV